MQFTANENGVLKFKIVDPEMNLLQFNMIWLPDCIVMHRQCIDNAASFSFGHKVILQQVHFFRMKNDPKVQLIIFRSLSKTPLYVYELI